MSDISSETVQRVAFSKVAASVIDGFDKVIYPDWETLFRSFNNQLSERMLVCLDEFTYLVKSCDVLPSIIQKLLNEKILKFDLILCGSSQHPFGESPKKSKKGIYHINDSLLRFHYQFIVPYRSILELGRMDMVMQVVQAQLPQFIGQCWELLCREYFSGNIIDGIAYNIASRWWGKIRPYAV